MPMQQISQSVQAQSHIDDDIRRRDLRVQIGAWKFGISPINWVNEDVITVGDHYTCEQLLQDFTALALPARKIAANSRKTQWS